LATTGHELRRVDLASIFKALADPNRLAIFELVRERGGEGRTVDETANTISKIASEFDLTLSTVSHHIKELRNAGLIRCEKVGQTVYCTPDPRALEEIDRFLREATS
jgi:DNA-binding transcriptional ArsR family regulator